MELIVSYRSTLLLFLLLLLLLLSNLFVYLFLIVRFVLVKVSILNWLEICKHKLHGHSKGHQIQYLA